jgi:secreted trypsin-like serine protease
MRVARRLLILLALVAAWPATASALVGGTPTQRDLPHMVAMEFRSSPSATQWSFRCGGSLVAPDVVLTAAHCVSGDESAGEPDTFPAAQFRFLAGTKKRSAGGEHIQAVEIREDPRYDDSDEGGYDVALVKLERSSSLGRPIRIARADETGLYAPGKDAVITGWGSDFYLAGGTSDDLEEIVVPIRSDDECQSTSAFALDPATMLCAGELQGGKDSCQGDSGGPLMVPDAGGGLILVADVSFGLGCAFPTQYGVYGEVAGAAMRPWVADNIAQMSSAGGQSTATPVAEPGTTPVTGTPAPGTTAPSQSGAAATGFAAPRRARLRMPARLLQRGRRVRVRLRTGETLRRVRIALVQRGRIIAFGTTKRLTGARTVVIRVRKRAKPRRGAARLRVRAVDAAGRPMTAARRVRLRR